MINIKITKIVISLAIGIMMTFFVYVALQDSLNRPSLSRLPIAYDTAISIVMKKENLTQSDLNDFSTRYVYIRGNGSIFESDSNTNSIGKYLGRSQEPTITTGNHFAWEVKYKKNNLTFYVDHATGEIIAESK
jgi:uncharacterized protein YpmB